jgi:hypothetical protein
MFMDVVAGTGNAPAQYRLSSALSKIETTKEFVVG